MTAETTYTFRPEAVMDRARGAASDTLIALDQAFDPIWDRLVPKLTGRLMRTGEAIIVRDQDTYWLILRAGYPTDAEPAGAYYAIFVELGTALTSPRSPLRNTAGMLMAVLPETLLQKSAARGLV